MAKWKEAIFHASEAIRLQPNFASHYNTLGTAGWECLSSALSSDVAGNILSEVGDAPSRQKAIKIYKRAIQIDPNFATAYSNLGRVLKVTICDRNDCLTCT